MPFLLRVLPGAVLAFATILGVRLVYYAFLVDWKINQRVLILGTGPFARLLGEEIEKRGDVPYEIAGFLTRNSHAEPDEVAAIGAERIVGEAKDVEAVVRTLEVDRVAVSIEERRGGLPFQALLNCKLAGTVVEEGQALYERLTGKIAVERLRPSYLIFSEGFELTKGAHFAKRTLDLFLSSLGLAISLPILLAVAAAIKLDTRGPVFFRQTRVGKGGRVFTLLKFRSMRVDAESATGPVWAREGDDRVTRIGAVIRRLRLDELPQMIHVLRGEMSFVGPRPERPFFVETLKKEIPFYGERLTVKPGITGWAQINYPYGSSTRDALEKLQYDLYYVKHTSVRFDLYILLNTVKVVLLRKGAR
jgi:sugar transferase (PEP-CTERM system associated)